MDPYIKAIASLLPKVQQDEIKIAYKRVAGRKKLPLMDFLREWEAQTGSSSTLVAVKTTYATKQAQIQMLVDKKGMKKTPFRAAAASLKGKIANRQTARQLRGFTPDEILEDESWE